MTINAVAISDAIAALTVAGVTIKDASNIPLTVKTTDCPIFMPFLNGWLGASTGSPATETTFGTPTTRTWAVHRVLHYVYLHKQIISGTIGTKYEDAVAKVEAIWTAVSALNVAGVDVENITHAEISELKDKAGNAFVGCLFDITVKEMINP